MEVLILYILPLLINVIFLIFGDGNKKSGFVIMIIAIIPFVNIMGAIFAIDTVSKSKY